MPRSSGAGAQGMTAPVPLRFPSFHSFPARELWPRASSVTSASSGHSLCSPPILLPPPGTSSCRKSPPPPPPPSPVSWGFSWGFSVGWVGGNTLEGGEGGDVTIRLGTEQCKNNGPTKATRRPDEGKYKRDNEIETKIKTKAEGNVRRGSKARWSKNLRQEPPR
jgi:hypothetical protein